MLQEFHTAINLKLENTEKVMTMYCILHSYLIRKCHKVYASHVSIVMENYETIRMNIETCLTNTIINLQCRFNSHTIGCAQQLQNEFMTYFNDGDMVPGRDFI